MRWQCCALAPGNGPGITVPEALAVFAEACAGGDPRTKNLYFDLGGIIRERLWAAHR